MPSGPETLECLVRRLSVGCWLDLQATELEVATVKGVRLPPPDISSYLRPAGLMETRYVRLISSLCAQTYYLSKMTVRCCFILIAWAGSLLFRGMAPGSWSGQDQATYISMVDH